MRNPHRNLNRYLLDRQEITSVWQRHITGCKPLWPVPAVRNSHPPVVIYGMNGKVVWR